MKSILNKSALLIIILLISANLFAADDETFTQANQYFENKQYDSAIVLYNSIIDDGQESANLYFNLGNAYFRKGDLGHTIISYMRAKKLAPDDDDINSNLQFVRQFQAIPMEGVELNPINNLLTNIVDELSLNLLAWLASLLFVSFWILMTLRYAYLYRPYWIKTALTFTLVFVIISSGLTTFKYKEDYLTKRAVIIAEDADVFTGPTSNADVELESAPGLVVKIIDETHDYYNILLENKRRGWILKSLVEVI